MKESLQSSEKPFTLAYSMSGSIADSQYMAPFSLNKVNGLKNIYETHTTTTILQESNLKIMEAMNY